MPHYLPISPMDPIPFLSCLCYFSHYDYYLFSLHTLPLFNGSLPVLPDLPILLMVPFYSHHAFILSISCLCSLSHPAYISSLSCLCPPSSFLPLPTLPMLIPYPTYDVFPIHPIIPVLFSSCLCCLLSSFLPMSYYCSLSVLPMFPSHPVSAPSRPSLCFQLYCIFSLPVPPVIS